MPVSFWVDEQTGLFFYNCDGYVTGAELLRAVVQRKVQAPGVYDVVVDLSRVQTLNVTPAEMEELARTPMDSSRLAIIAPRPALFGLGRMFQIKVEVRGHQRQIDIFKNPDEAILWVRGARAAAAGL